MTPFSQHSPNVSVSPHLDLFSQPLPWAQPFADGTCGPNLEYDNAFLELQKAAAGKPESQFEPATPPDWNAVESGAEALLAKSLDLRLLLLWAESQINLRGFQSLPKGLLGLVSLIQNAWPVLNPPLDEGDPYARLNVIESLGHGGSFFQSLRNALLFKDARVGELRAKDFEILFGNVAGAVPSVSREQVEQYLKASTEQAARLREVVEQSQFLLNRLEEALHALVGAEQAPQLTEIKSLLRCLQASLPEPPLEQTVSLSPPSGLGDLPAVALQATAVSVGFDPKAVHVGSRAQALAAIDAVCAYLEHAEPSNPAQLMLKRARRLIDKNFMQLLKDLAPDALSGVAKIMGVKPDSFEPDDR
ncbi:MAG TPA: type VI secretion system ImpA family N-terminal domain-containing protein [Limnobacter sp.]|nr:type VI secretion system ImpA family N-terminal domain-containing protein [Limnobacter sp.]